MLNNIAAIMGGGAAAVGDYQSISTTTLSSATASITFSSIPATYTHLQLRWILQEARATYGIDDASLQLGAGSIDTAANYSWHRLAGDGSTATATAGTSTSNIYFDEVIATTTGGNFAAGVVDILDYSNTNKYKTVRALLGNDFNGTLGGYGGRVGLYSGSWRSTGAVDTLRINNYIGNFQQNSQIALYGIK
jgi:hypothetical protein